MNNVSDFVRWRRRRSIRTQQRIPEQSRAIQKELNTIDIAVAAESDPEQLARDGAVAVILNGASEEAVQQDIITAVKAKIVASTRQSLGTLRGLHAKTTTALEHAQDSKRQAQEDVETEEPFITRLTDTVKERWSLGTSFNIILSVALTIAAVLTSIYAVMISMGERISYEHIRAISYGLSFVACTSYSLATYYRKQTEKRQKKLAKLIIRTGIASFYIAVTAFFIENAAWDAYRGEEHFDINDVLAAVEGTPPPPQPDLPQPWWLPLSTLLPWFLLLSVGTFSMDLCLIAWMKVHITETFDRCGNPFYRPKVENPLYEEKRARLRAWQTEVAQLTGLEKDIKRQLSDAGIYVNKLVTHEATRAELAFSRKLARLREAERLRTEINSFL